jgi:hypothetical protein
MKDSPAMVDLISSGLEALVRADLQELRQLKEQALNVRMPHAEQERTIAINQLKSLRELLVLTRHNLRLLHVAYGEPGGYGTLRS